MTYFVISVCVVALIAAIMFFLGYVEGYNQGDSHGYREAIDDYREARKGGKR